MGPPQSFVPPTGMMGPQMGMPGRSPLDTQGKAPTNPMVVDHYVNKMAEVRNAVTQMDDLQKSEDLEHLRQIGKESYPLHPEDAHLGYEPHGLFYREDDPAHPFQDEPGLARTVIRAPHARFEGGPSFVNLLCKRNSTFAYSELCATPFPESALAPVPQVKQKTWYNAYVYVPEQASHIQRQYMERFVPGPDGEWLDVVKCRRMVTYLEDERKKAAQWKAEQEAVKHGDDVEVTDYTDAYSGERLVAMHGEMMPKLELYERYKIHKSDWGKYVDDVSLFDYDNLRTPWPFGRFDRNKKVSQHAYEWFDRRNCHIMSDKSYTMLELPSYYVDEAMYWKWRPDDAQTPTAFAEDALNRAQHLDDYPYKM